MINRIIILLSFYVIYAPPVIQASTFVGNGGCVYDAELTSTLSAISQYFKLVDVADEDLCTCSENYTTQAECRILLDLTDKQKEQCQSFISTYRRKFITFSKRDGPIKFEWTRKSIEVKEGTTLRPVDAVAIRKLQKIVIQDEFFGKLKPAQKMSLLVHEIGHIISDTEIEDHTEFGSFTGKDGGRRFLDAIGAAVVMDSRGKGVLESIESVSKISKSSYTFFVRLGAGIAYLNQDEIKNVYLDDEVGTTALELAFFRDIFGLYFATHSRDLTTNDPRSFTVNYHSNLYMMGPAAKFRLFPTSDGRMSQILMGLRFGYLYQREAFLMTDAFNSVEETRSSNGLHGAVTFEFPLVHGFWLDTRVSLEKSDVKFDTFNYKRESLTPTLQLGVSYAN